MGDVVRLSLPGGGGYGDPSNRTQEAIRRDLKGGYITGEAAKRDYEFEE